MGLPQEVREPKPQGREDTLVGTLDYCWVRVATATMGYKHRTLDASQIKMTMREPNFLVKVIPHVDGTACICELAEYRLENIEIRGAWAGPGSLQLNPHALAPVADLPVLEVVSAVHCVADLTLGLGKVVHDYLRPAATRATERRLACAPRQSVVTGGASGIGKEIARAFQREGAQNTTLFTCLSLFAFSAACAIFLILELSRPFKG